MKFEFRELTTAEKLEIIQLANAGKITDLRSKVWNLYTSMCHEIDLPDLNEEEKEAAKKSEVEAVKMYRSRLDVPIPSAMNKVQQYKKKLSAL